MTTNNPLRTDYTEHDEAMAGVDYRYREWQSAAARKIVEQIVDGTLERVSTVGERVGKTTKSEAMVSQIVGILMSHCPCTEE